MTEIVTEIDFIREAYDLDVFAIFGNDPYTIPVIILTGAWMKTLEELPPEKTQIHLWGYVDAAYEKLDNGYTLNDRTYREIMKRLTERGVVEPKKIRGGMNPAYDYVLTEYGKTICKELKTSVQAQIELEKRRRTWRRRISTQLSHKQDNMHACMEITR